MGYIHYRTVQCEFYVPLDMFKDSKHLIEIMLDIIIAIEFLYDRGILHRDISVPNIMIAMDGSGRLIDLDMAGDRYDVDGWLSVRTGTWKFMSTRLLTTPGKVHELRDDLESLWFVLIYEALRFVKHNKPFGIGMETIFDLVDVCHGIHIGGVGKRHLYHSGSVLMTRTLDFGNKPFNTLVKQAYLLFQSLNTYYLEQDRKLDPEEEDDPNSPAVVCVKKLDSCTEIKRLCREALDAQGWPESCDKVEDQYPPQKHMTPEQKETVALSYVNYSLTQPGEPSGTKRKEEEESSSAFENKRVKVDPLWKRIWLKCAGLVRG